MHPPYATTVAATTSVSSMQNSNVICADGENIFPSEGLINVLSNYRSATRDLRLKERELPLRSALKITSRSQTGL